MKKFTHILFLLLVSFVWSQNPYCINYSVNEGFPTSTVYSVNQDIFGHIWFSTDVGIVKYDSHKFELINTDNGLSDNEVFQMKTDWKGRTWLLTLTGKLSYLYKNKIYNENNSELVKKASGTSITTDLYEDNNTIYIAYRNGEIAIIKPNNSVQKIKSLRLSIGGIWNAQGNLNFVSPEGVFNIKNQKVNLSNSSETFLKLHHSKFGNYISSQNSYFKLDLNNNLEKIIELPKEIEILNSFVENKNKIWICTRTGFYLIENKKITEHYFKDLTTTSIIKDFEGGYWISTLKNGTYYVPSFSFQNEKLDNKSNLKLNCISINERKEIWIGGENNDYYVKKDKETKFIKNVLWKSDRTDKIPNIRFFNNNTYVIGKLNVKKIDENGISKNLKFSANDFLIDKNYSFVGYTYTYKIPSDKVENFGSNYFDDKILLYKRSNVFCKADDKIWIGTNNGLYEYIQNSKIVFWGQYSNNLNSSIEDIYFDKTTKTTFVATDSKGIVVIKNNKIIYQITTKNGLNSNSCNTIKKIKSNYYLIGTNYGLNAIIFKNNSFLVKNLNSNLGIQNIKIQDLDFLDNKVYLATENGLLFFDINKINAFASKPMCSIIEVLNNSKIIENNSRLDYNNIDLSIYFNGISYLSKGDLTYFYKLKGFDKSWSQSKQNQINYKTLPAGNYEFLVFCKNANGIQSNIQKISFEILAPFWQKWWFITLSLIAIGLLIFGFIKFRLKIQERKFEKEKAQIQLEKQLVELEQKALRMQMNPHFIFNALNTIKGYYTEGNLVDASTYISKFSKLLRKLLESEEQTTTLDNEIEMLRFYIELTQIRYDGKFDYSIFVDPEIKVSEVLIPNLLLQPIVENAIIHGLGPKPEKGLLKIEFIKDNDTLMCVVNDNGIGREAALKNQKNKEHQSKATPITIERLKLFSEKSTFKIIDNNENNFSLGTTVEIKIPLKNNW